MIGKQNQINDAAKCLTGGRARNFRSLSAVGLILGAFCCLMTGCMQSEKKEPVRLAAPFDRPVTIAVAPGFNHSGSSDFDTVKVADLMASELSGVEGVRVIVVNRVLAALAEQGIDRIQSAHHALEICDRLGADAILVFAVIEYDPYTPVMGISAQMFGHKRAGPMLDPVATSRLARPLPIQGPSEADRLWVEVQQTYNGQHETVIEEVKEYADSRTADEGPYGWRIYVASQRHFIRFCCYQSIREMMTLMSQDSVLAQASAVR